jgi:hypothetical protein
MIAVLGCWLLVQKENICHACLLVCVCCLIMHCGHPASSTRAKRATTMMIGSWVHEERSDGGAKMEEEASERCVLN